MAEPQKFKGRSTQIPEVFNKSETQDQKSEYIFLVIEIEIIYKTEYS